MELRHLRYFVAVGEDEHYGRAAQRLRVAQPALSSQIQDLEREIGAQLFERLPRGVRLSAAGKVFLEDCRRNNVVPTLVLAYPLQEAAEALAALTPGARQVLSRGLQPGVFWVVALAGDGNSFATMATPEDRGPLS